jgi:antitoxin (DNA-binding transcriptional repressor) of toxin-antitoxin stability system
MQTTSLSVTEIVRNFSEYVNRATYRGERFVLTKGRKAVAELRPLPAGRTLGELGALLESLPRLTEAEAERFAADIEDARAHLPQIGDGDPWRS